MSLKTSIKKNLIQLFFDNKRFRITFFKSLFNVSKKIKRGSPEFKQCKSEKIQVRVKIHQIKFKGLVSKK